MMLCAGESRSFVSPIPGLRGTCACGHALGEHVPGHEDPNRTCAWSRELSYTEPEIESKAPCDCAGFVPLVQVAK